MKQFGIGLATTTALWHVFAFAQAPPQSPAAPTPTFEVASIKPSGPKSVRDFGGGPGSKDPERYHANSASLRDLIAVAWKVDYFQISSSTPADRQNFDVVVKVPPGATREQFRLMLQRLLADRFNLKVHIESRQFQAYEMVVAKTGLKIKEVLAGDRPATQDVAQPPRSTEDGWPDLPGDRPGLAASNTVTGGYWLVRLKAREEPLSQLANILHVPGDPPVVDKTALTGKYTFSLEYTIDVPGSHEQPEAPPSAPDLATALQQQLGLQLISRKLPFDVVVVDSFNKLPTEN